MVVVKLTEKQLAANKDFVLRNEIEMIRMEVISLLQKDCRPILANVKIAQGDTEVPEQWVEQLPLKQLKTGTVKEYNNLQPEDYQEVSRYADYWKKNAPLSDTAGSLWLQNIRFRFNQDGQSWPPTYGDREKKGVVLLDFYRRLGKQYGAPAPGQSNLTTTIALNVKFAKDTKSSTPQQLEVDDDGNLVIEACTSSGEFSLSWADKVEMYEYICKNFLGGTPAIDDASHDTKCLSWTVDSNATFTGDFIASNLTIDTMQATDVLCNGANATDRDCTLLHNLYNSYSSSGMGGITLRKLINDIYKGEKGNSTDLDKILQCLENSTACNFSLGGRNFSSQDQLVNYLKGKYKADWFTQVSNQMLPFSWFAGEISG